MKITDFTEADLDRAFNKHMQPKIAKMRQEGVPEEKIQFIMDELRTSWKEFFPRWLEGRVRQS